MKLRELQVLLIAEEVNKKRFEDDEAWEKHSGYGNKTDEECCDLLTKSRPRSRFPWMERNGGA